MLLELLKGSKVLNKQEMKNVTGGAGSCQEGERLFNCTVRDNVSGNTFSGKACGKDTYQAQDRVLEVHPIEGFSVSCS